MQWQVRVLLVLFALAAGAGAWGIARRPAVHATWLQDWELHHPDVREASPEQLADFFDSRARQFKADLLWLLVGLSAGTAGVAVAPSLARRAGGAIMAVLVVGSVVLGLCALGRSAVAQVGLAQNVGWTLADDNLDVVAGERAPTLRAWRESIDEGDAVILVGANDTLLNTTAWALAPRPLYALTYPIPAGTSPEEVAQFVRASGIGASEPRRWIVDMEAQTLHELSP